MWALHHWLPVHRLLAAPWTWLGAVVAAGAVAIDLASIARFARARTTVSPLAPEKASQLVTEGPYAVSRNPMYVGLALLLVAWALWLGSASPWLVPPLFVALLTRFQIKPEETALAARFGEPYREYLRAVPRWIGRRGSRTSPRS